MPIQSSNVRSRGRNRRNIPQESRPTSTDATATLASTILAIVTLNLSVPCTLNGIPQYPTLGVNAGLPVSAVMITPTQVALTYAATQAASTHLKVPPGEPALRTYSGGYVNAATIDPSP